MKVLVVICHPRRDSLTGAMADAFIDGLMQYGHEVEIADLHAEDFDPHMPIADEPDYADPSKIHSEAVRDELARIEHHDDIALFFPVWWWSVPAMLKGWIDRVWNFYWAYGWADSSLALFTDTLDENAHFDLMLARA